MNLIFGMKVIYLMRLDSLVKIVAERCTRNTTKVPTVWNINYQIIKNNNTTTHKKGIGVFFPDAFLTFFWGSLPVIDFVSQTAAQHTEILRHNGHRCLPHGNRDESYWRNGLRFPSNL